MNTYYYTHCDVMGFKRLDITLHPEDIKKLDKIAKARGYKRSTMIAKLIQEYLWQKHEDTRDLGKLTEQSHELRGSTKKKKVKR
jgi:metal-responsive CopG/Arc/MetJ family transcriptional regulator